ncbi:hypothetical protein TNCV_2513621 [Trichonephila clavipes]|nr:hypothetical protein TNCV_2513621 [Trichonephila clavipes]
MVGPRWSGDFPTSECCQSGRASLLKIRVRCLLFRTSSPQNLGAELFAVFWILSLRLNRVSPRIWFYGNQLQGGGELLGRVDRQNSLFRTAKTTIIKSGFHASFVWNPLRMLSTSDEAHFWLNGYVNKQNCRIWSEANPQVYVETPLHPEKLTVWCALWAGGILL